MANDNRAAVEAAVNNVLAEVAELAKEANLALDDVGVDPAPKDYPGSTGKRYNDAGQWLGNKHPVTRY